MNNNSVIPDGEKTKGWLLPTYRYSDKGHCGRQKVIGSSLTVSKQECRNTGEFKLLHVVYSIGDNSKKGGGEHSTKKQTVD